MCRSTCTCGMVARGSGRAAEGRAHASMRVRETSIRMGQTRGASYSQQAGWVEHCSLPFCQAHGAARVSAASARKMTLLAMSRARASGKQECVARARLGLASHDRTIGGTQSSARCTCGYRAALPGLGLGSKLSHKSTCCGVSPLIFFCSAVGLGSQMPCSQSTEPREQTPARIQAHDRVYQATRSASVPVHSSGDGATGHWPLASNSRIHGGTAQGDLTPSTTARRTRMLSHTR